MPNPAETLIPLGPMKMTKPFRRCAEVIRLHSADSSHGDNYQQNKNTYSNVTRPRNSCRSAGNASPAWLARAIGRIGNSPAVLAHESRISAAHSVGHSAQRPDFRPGEGNFYWDDWHPGDVDLRLLSQDR